MLFGRFLEEGIAEEIVRLARGRGLGVEFEEEGCGEVAEVDWLT